MYRSLPLFLATWAVVLACGPETADTGDPEEDEEQRLPHCDSDGFTSYVQRPGCDVDFVELSGPRPEVTICKPGGAFDATTREGLPMYNTYREWRYYTTTSAAGSSPTRFTEQVVYDCVEPCDEADSCRMELGDLDVVFFVVDGVAGWFRFVDDPSFERVIYQQEGVGACVPGGEGEYDPHPVWTPMEAITRRDTALISPFYAPGMTRGDLAPGLGTWRCSGWATNTSGEPTSNRKLAIRSASLLRWAHAHLVGDRPLGYLGHSAGARAGFAALHWGPGHGVDVDEVVDAWLFAGGPMIWDIRAACGDARLWPAECLCTDDPLQTCECDGTQLENYGLPSGNFVGATWHADYLRQDRSLPCTTVQPDTPVEWAAEPPAGDGSLRHSDGLLDNRAPIVMTLCSDHSLFGSDTQGHVSAQYGQVFRKLEGEKHWRVFDDCDHLSNMELPYGYGPAHPLYLTDETSIPRQRNVDLLLEHLP